MLYHFLKSKGILESLTHGEIIDIGSGDGYVGKEFEDNGFEVTYIEKKNGLDATVYEYPSDYFGLAIARNSLPFMGNKQFDVISNIYKSLKKEGYFYGTVFGKNEPWVKEGFVTAVDFDELTEFLKSIGFSILWQSEENGIGPTMKGDLKDWHILKFLVQKT